MNREWTRIHANKIKTQEQREAEPWIKYLYVTRKQGDS